jgi:hypothetical protein
MACARKCTATREDTEGMDGKGSSGSQSWYLPNSCKKCCIGAESEDGFGITTNFMLNMMTFSKPPQGISDAEIMLARALRI